MGVRGYKGGQSVTRICMKWSKKRVMRAGMYADSGPDCLIPAHLSAAHHAVKASRRTAVCMLLNADCCCLQQSVKASMHAPLATFASLDRPRQ